MRVKGIFPRVLALTPPPATYPQFRVCQYFGCCYVDLMKAGALSLVVGISLIGSAAFGNESIATFAKKSLAVDLQIFPFGITVNPQFHPYNHRYYVNTFLDKEDSLDWYENRFSSDYSENFPGRTILFGFRHGVLAAVLVRVPVFLSGPDVPDAMAKSRKEQLQIQADLRNANPQRWLNFDDGQNRIYYDALCGAEPDSLYSTSILIAPTVSISTIPILPGDVNPKDLIYTPVGPPSAR